MQYIDNLYLSRLLDKSGKVGEFHVVWKVATLHIPVASSAHLGTLFLKNPNKLLDYRRSYLWYKYLH